MKVAPHDSCIACFRGDTDTGLVLQGEAEFLAAGLLVMGLSEQEAMGTVEVFAEEMGCKPGKVPAGVRDWVLRVCRDCASKAGLTVGKLGAGELPGYAPPPGTSWADE